MFSCLKSDCASRLSGDCVNLNAEDDVLCRPVMDMNGKGCNLMVSPSGMAQVPHLRVQTGHFSSPSLHPDATSGNPALLPTLSLRRQVLTNGKLGFPQTSRHQAPPLSLPASSSKQLARPSFPDNGTKGKQQ